jgi:hypothetical protein
VSLKPSPYGYGGVNGVRECGVGGVNIEKGGALGVECGEEAMDACKIVNVSEI